MDPAIIEINKMTIDVITKFFFFFKSPRIKNTTKNINVIPANKSSKKTLDLESLQKFVVSFRNENHFHEEVCEQMFKMLSEKLQPEELMIGMLYTRRGGIDICPIRSNKLELLDVNLISLEILTRKTINQ